MSERAAYHHEFRVPYDFTDAQGRCFYANYWLIADAARYAFLEHGLGLGEHGVVELEHGFFIAHLECDYLAGLAFYDRVDVAVEPADLGRSSLRLGYRMRNAATGEAVFDGSSVVVWADVASGRSAPWPEPIREALLRFAGPGVLKG